MTGTKNTKINHTIFFEYWKSYSKKVKSFDTEAEEKSFHAEVSEIVKSGNVTNFRERIMGEGVVIKSHGKFKSLLHHAVTCEDVNRIEMISTVLQSSMDDINHQDENGDNPLMHLLYEAQEKGKYTKKDLEEIIKFLVERGASFKLENNNQKTADDLITVLINEGILDDGIDEIINKAERSSNLPNQIKAQLSKYITNNGKSIIREVAVYGNYAQINLDSDGAEVKISEFFQDKVCKDNGISGFSILHNNKKGGMHVLFSSDGVRHYTVTDGSYDMTLDWVVGGKECTITININKDGVVVVGKDGVIVEERNGLTDEQLKANKYVTINGLSLFDVINNGRNREKKIAQESMQEADEVYSNASLNSEQIRKNNVPPQLQNGLGRSRETKPKVVGSDGDMGLGFPSAPRLAGKLDDQDESFNVGGSLTTRLPSKSEFQTRVNLKKASTPKRTEQSDPRNTNPKSIDGGTNTPGTSNVPELIEYEQYYNNLMLAEESQNRGASRGTNPKFAELYYGFSFHTGNAKHKSIGDQSTWQKFNRELQGRFTKPNMGFKSPSVSNSQTKQSDSGFSSPANDSNRSTLNQKQLEARLDSLKQEQVAVQLFDHVLDQIKSKNGAILKWMENKRNGIQQAADGNGLGQAENQLGSKSCQKESPTLQQLTEKDFLIPDLSGEESGLKSTDRREMTKKTLEYLYGTGDYSEPAHKGEVREKLTNSYDKNRVGLANGLRDGLNKSNKQEGPHALMVRANSSRGKKEGRSTF